MRQGSPIGTDLGPSPIELAILVEKAFSFKIEAVSTALRGFAFVLAPVSEVEVTLVATLHNNKTRPKRAA